MQFLHLEVIVKPLEAVRAEFAARTVRLAGESIDTRGRFTMAIPGGSLLTALLPALIDADIDWQRTDVFWVDERGVPPDHPDSNYGTARDGWLQEPTRRGARVFPMPGGADDLAAGAAAYAATLRDTLGSRPVLDLAVLGVGPDGHVASLFPGGAALDEREQPVAAVTDAPKAPARRLTLTLPVLARSRTTCVAIFGTEKRDVVGCLLEDAACEMPVARLLGQVSTAWLLLDAGSAGRAG
ncbi:MAG: 6-phosphogluconolactonase [Gemmatimonadaceae bacterium]